MKKLIFTLIAMLLPMLASAVEIDGIYYKLDSGAKTAKVTSNPNYYQGDVSIPETIEYGGTTYNVTSIGDSAFNGCESLTSVTIPSSVTSIGYAAFTSSSSLTSIIVDEANMKLKSVDGVLMSKDGTTLIAYPAGKSGTAYIIPDGVTSIGYAAFQQCFSLTSVTFPSSLTSIGEDSFFCCLGLTSITIPDGVTTIGKWAFYLCNLTSVTIGSGMTYIHDNAFSLCTELTDVFCRAMKVPTIKGDAFYDSNIANATLHVPAGSVEAYKAAEQWNQFKEIVAIGSTETDEGDANGDGEIDVADIDFVIEHIGENLNETNKAADVNDDDAINVADVDYIIERIK